MLAPVVSFKTLCVLLSIVAANGLVPQQLNVEVAFLLGKLKDTIYKYFPKRGKDGNKVAHLKRCIYGSQQLLRE
jgi:hypothetical protein